MEGAVNRRSFIRTTAGLAIPGTLASLVAACAEVGDTGPLEPNFGDVPVGPFPGGGYGSINNDQGPVRLPQGFQCKVLGAIGDPMSDGSPTPIALDGMACIGAHPYDRLIRNHEDRNGTSAPPIGPNPYDRLCGGGTTTLAVDKERNVMASFVSLSGTTVNCAGGQTPWYSWLSAEETVVGPREGYEKTHGWVFEVSALANECLPTEPIKAMGRFSHEAVAVDPRTSIVYQTEDNGFPPGSGLFRYIPNNPRLWRQLDRQGRLQMARIRGNPRLEIWRGASRGILPGHTFEVDWVDIPHVDPGDTTNETTRRAALFMQGYDQGGAAFNRLEGCWFGRESMFFQDTRGGTAQRGHVWRYTPGAAEGQGGSQDVGLLTLIYESPGASTLDSPDNICVSPRGGLVLCEDGSGDQWLRGLTPTGQIFDFALNILNDAEFAGACFAINGTLFVNIQGATAGNATAPGVRGSGLTMAIWGPWKNGSL
jgi:secreted PhoX family phosphatase